MILAIETATEVCSAAIVRNGESVAERSVKEKNIHSESLLQFIDTILGESGFQKKEIEAIAVSIGPGSFTGLRIGLSAAKGLAMALDVPIIAVPTLDGIAESYRLHKLSAAEEQFCAMIDAKREETFYAFYSVTGSDILRRSEYSIVVKNSIIEEAKVRIARTEQPPVSASAIGILAERKREQFTVLNFSDLEPLYLRDFVATLPKSKV